MKNVKLFFLPLLFIALTTIKGFGLPGHEPVPGNILNLKVSDILKLSAKQFSALTGRKMNLIEKVEFGVFKMKMRHDLKKDHNLMIKDYLKGGRKKLSGVWIILIIIGSILLLAILILAIAMGWGLKK